MLLIYIISAFFPCFTLSLSINSLLFPLEKPLPSKNITHFKGIFDENLLSSTSDCPFNCNGHGVCDKKNFTCLCEADYQGSSCSTYCPKNCSNHGVCAIGLGCLCSESFEGFFLKLFIFFLSFFKRGRLLAEIMSI